MNPWQLAQQLKHELQQVTWPGGDVVFGDGAVFVYAGAAPSDEELPSALPVALVTIDAGEVDADNPELVEQAFTIATVVEVAGDPLGEHAVIGGTRPDAGSSAGAGVAEVAERVRAAVQRLTGADGVTLHVTAGGTGAPATVGRGRHLAFDELRLSAWCTSQPHYAAPQELRHAGGVWSWAGTACTRRFDFARFVLGYVTGSTPATSVDDLDGIVYQGPTAMVTLPATGGRVYHAFAIYDARGNGSEAESAPIVGSYRET